MTFPYSPEDRPDPADQHAVRARVPEHVSRGVFSTGVIVMTAPTEFVIDFIQNLGRPHQVVARIIMPHPVLPQFGDALHKNIELYRGRYGNLPQPNVPGVTLTSGKPSLPHEGASDSESFLPRSPSSPPSPMQPSDSGEAAGGSPGVGPGIAQPRSADSEGGQVPPQQRGPRGAESDFASGSGAAGDSGTGGPGFGGLGSGGPVSGGPAAGGSGAAGGGHGPGEAQPASHQVRRASAQEIYDDLKLRDEILSGSYANAVMIGHGPHEFSFDFITNFYPHSAVSARVFLAAGQVARLAESLRGAWDQIRNRFQGPSDPNAPPRAS